MILSLKKIFTRTAKSPEKSEPAYIQEFSKAPYNFQSISLNDLLMQKEAMWNIYTNKSDGFLIKNFLSSEEVDTIMSNFKKVIDGNPAHTSVGFTYPPVFAEFSNRLKNETEAKKNEARGKYFKETGDFNTGFKQEFGVDVRQRIEDFFTGISGGREIKVAETADNTGNYPFATFRLLVPDKGLMSVHCGNYFGKTFEEFYKDLTHKVAVENQMSFFIMLQEPEAGGELTLFNFRWKPGQTKKDNTEDNEIIQPDGSKMYVEDNKEIIKDKIVPKKGDMILFQGGNIWHRVETVRGAVPRITFGGFIGISKDQSKFYYWS